MGILATLRSARRSGAFLAFIAWRLTLRITAISFGKSARSRRAAATWLQGTAEGCRRILRLRIQRQGSFPACGLLVANHLSYLDIILLAAARPCVFVSKSEVRAWPVFGWCAALGGTIFVDRARRGDVAGISAQMRSALAEGLLLVLFPEGTSSGGATVLPFKSSLLEPVLRLGCPVSAAAISYSLARGSVADEICYWRDMTLVPHLLNVFAKPAIHATVRLGVPRPRTGDRKALARELHAEVAALHSAGELGKRLPEPSDETLPVIARRLPAAAETQNA